MDSDQRERHEAMYGKSGTEHREVFFMHNGPPPWACDWCNELIESAEELTVHHTDDGLHPDVLVACHRHKTEAQTAKGERSCHYELNQRDRREA